MTTRKNKGLIFVEITKVNEDERTVEGYATTDSVDLEGDIVDLDATREAVEEYRKWGNVRYMHQAHAVGVVKDMEVDNKGLYVKVKVVDDECWVKVKEGVLKGFSIGFRIIECVWDGLKEVWRITKYLLIEVSLVDRPANPDCVYDVIKRADDGAIPPGDPGADIKTTVAGLLAKALAFLGINDNPAKTPTQEAEEMTEEEIRKLVTEEVGKAVAGFGEKLDEIKAALPAPADPDPDESKAPDPEPAAPADPEKAPEATESAPPKAEGEKAAGKFDELKTEPGIGEKLDDIQKRVKELEAGRSRAATGQDPSPEKGEKWAGVMENVFR
ncbi:MAG: HK97 family phage prohead protease [Candidatus Zixiibacteriota bacterium]|jgi:HK97 family phage prohead protease